MYQLVPSATGWMDGIAPLPNPHNTTDEVEEKSWNKPQQDNFFLSGFEPGPARFKVRHANRYSTAVDLKMLTTTSQHIKSKIHVRRSKTLKTRTNYYGSLDNQEILTHHKVYKQLKFNKKLKNSILTMMKMKKGDGENRCRHVAYYCRIAPRRQPGLTSSSDGRITINSDPETSIVTARLLRTAEEDDEMVVIVMVKKKR
ncbi:hypothetical protein ANN_20738 [Periplaneta americana]|uniref:Uncharacterized protein n=1 Tax=Periplaneta americana TaxID=6978 RepID=A0ABQ8SDT0_PERAM|nr:hypothetical protein ANN_20738 [Periplaneta americana]